MTIDEIKCLMEALDEVIKERDRIIECKTIDKVLEIIKSVLSEADENTKNEDYDAGWIAGVSEVKESVLELKGGERE